VPPVQVVGDHELRGAPALAGPLAEGRRDAGLKARSQAIAPVEHNALVQIATVAAEAHPLFEAEARERQVAGGKSAGRGRPIGSSQTVTDLSGDANRSIRQAAKATGAGIHATETMVKVKREAPEVFEAAKAGEYKTVAETTRAGEHP
jgi:hypothetical protein